MAETNNGTAGQPRYTIRKALHWLMIWPCLWIGMLFRHENWFSEQATLHWLKSRRYL